MNRSLPNDAYFLLTDQVGTLRAVADTTGAIVKRIDYDSFGNIIADSNPVFSVPFGFAGGLHDRDTGLVRFGYRDYSTELGRFTAKDPIDFDGGDTNLYAYVMNDPINWIDPDGLSAAGKLIKLSKKLFGKVMPGEEFKRPRVKVYGDEQGKNYLSTKIFKDGTVESKINLKVPKGAIETAVDALKNAGLAILPILFEYLDPFDADAMGNGELPEDLRSTPRSCP